VELRLCFPFPRQVPSVPFAKAEHMIVPSAARGMIDVVGRRASGALNFAPESN